MRGYVVTLLDDPRSVKVAERCIASGEEHGFEVEMWEATVAGDARAQLDALDLPTGTWNPRWSSADALLGNFCSQYRLWQKLAETSEDWVILEHDAVFTAPLPDVAFDKVLQIGKPSFGRFERHTEPGVHRLFSKRMFAGAHAYIVSPEGAKALSQGARVHGAQPVDAFFSLRHFSWLQELWPWIAEVRETFSTIQKKDGCRAKHQFKEGYEWLS